MEEETSSYTIENVATNDLDIEEALVLAGHGVFHYVLLFGCAFIMFAHSFENYNTGMVITASQCDFNMTPEQKGLMNSIMPIGIITSSYLWGFLADVKGRRFSMIIALGMDFLLAIGSSFAPNYYSFIAIRYFSGFFICGAATLMYTYIGEFHSITTRARAILFLFIIAELASICIPVVAWLIIPQKWSFDLPSYTYHSWRIFVAVSGIPSLFAFLILLFFLPETPTFLLAQGRTEDAIIVLNSMYATNNRSKKKRLKIFKLKPEISEDLSEVPDPHMTIRNLLKRIRNQTAPLFNKELIQCTMLICLIQFLLLANFCSIQAWIPEILNVFAQYSSLHPESSMTISEIIDESYHYNKSINSEEKFEDNLKLNELNETLFNNQTVLSENCRTIIDLSTFQNSFIMNVFFATMGLIVAFTVNIVGKKKMLLILLLISGTCNIGFAFTKTSVQVLIVLMLSLIGGMASFIITAAVIEIYPTNLRALATCLSMMIGRIGEVAGSMMIGTVMAINSFILFVTLGVITIITCGLILFLPTQ